MAKQVYYEGQKFANPNDPSAPVLVYRGGKFMPEASIGVDAKAPGSAYLTSGEGRQIPAAIQEELSGYRKGTEKVMGARANALRFQALNAENRTGGVMNLLAPVRGAFDKGYSEMNSISAKLTPAEREVNSGAMSDKDTAMYKAATLDPNKPKATNDALAKVIRAGAIRQADYSAFMEEWAKRRGDITGAQEAWLAYSGANPMFRVEGGNTQVNGWTPWRKWFGVEMAKPQGAGAGPVATGNGWTITEVK